MPKLGEVAKGKDIGYKNNYIKYVWHSCKGCGKERWVAFVKRKPINLMCESCGHSGERCNKWKGGKNVDKAGYVNLWISPESPYFSMANRNRQIHEHRLVIAQSLGRCLLKSEYVHHINGIKTDNRIENLELISQVNHNIKTSLCRNCELRKEIRLLRWQIKEQSDQIRNLTSKLMGVNE